MFRSLPFVVLLAGCGLSEDAFIDEQLRLGCERDNTCAAEAGGETQDCAALSAPPNNSAFVCTYQQDAAQDCLDAIETAPCAGTTYEQPAACSDVFVDCAPR